MAQQLSIDLPYLCNYAVELHRTGKLVEAERLYLQILTFEPDNFASQHMLGLVRHQQERNVEALELISAALEKMPDVAEAWANKGLVLGALGRQQEALSSFERALTLNSSYPEALNNRGIVQGDMNRSTEALVSFNKALALKPDYAEALNNRGNIFRRLKRFNEALASFDQAIKIIPDYKAAINNRISSLVEQARLEREEANFNESLNTEIDNPLELNKRGDELRARKRSREALENYDKAIAINPKNAELWNSRGHALRDLKRFKEALKSYENAYATGPNNAEALYNQGNTLRDLGRDEEALASFDKAVALKPTFANAWSNRANVLRDLKRFDEALGSYEKALTAEPCHAEALNNRGAALWSLKRYGEALASYEEAISIRPDYAEALNNRGVIFWSLRRFDEAVASYDRALEFKPSYVAANFNRGIALVDLHRFDEALLSYEMVLTLDPDHLHALSAVAQMKARLCDWRGIVELTEALESNIRTRTAVIHPFVFLGYSGDAALQLECARYSMQDKMPVLPQPLRSRTAYRHDKIRVAYLSADFKRHATAFLMAELFERHDRGRFETFGISFGHKDGSNIRTRIVKGFDQFYDVDSQSERETAELLRNLEIDIAVDLKGYTTDFRPEILSYRPAPVQVNYLGYPGTMGVEFIDYVIGDKIVTPFDQRPFFSEKIVQLPNCYQVNDSQREIAQNIPSRGDVGLPERGFVFCCFNDCYKFKPGIFDIWMRLLAAVPGSVLWLMANNPTASQNLRQEAEARGVAQDRLIFAPGMELSEHLARHRLADLFLDTLPYNAHTTTSDALWTGLPVVTCLGTSFGGRVAASLLNAIGLPALVTNTLVDYEALALKLAQDPSLLASVRLKLQENRLTYPLFNTDLFRKDIESAYVRMWEIAESGAAPQSFAVERCETADS